MKSVSIIGLLIVSVSATFADSVHVGPFPVPGYADTEVSTNIEFKVDWKTTNEMRLMLECEASATNALEVMIGCDADGNGVLSLEEGDLVLGYDCGDWFSRGIESNQVHEASASSSGCVCRELILKRHDVSRRWNLMRVTHRGVAGLLDHAVLFDRKSFVLFIR